MIRSSAVTKKQFVCVPSAEEVIYILLTSAGLLLLITLPSVLANKDPGSYRFITGLIGDFWDSHTDFLNGSQAAKILTFCLWAVVGALVYIGGWITWTFFDSVKDDVSPLHGLVMPKGYTPQRERSLHIVRLLVRMLACVALLAWLAFFFGGSLNNLSRYFARQIDAPSVFSYMRAIGTILLVSVELYALIVILRLIALKKRLFS